MPFDDPATTSETTALSTGVWARVEALVADLRRRGVGISTTEVLDTAEACRHIDIGRRTELRVALASTLVKQEHHQATFASAFERHFPRRLAVPPDAALGQFGDSSDDDLAVALDGAIHADGVDDEALVRELVQRHAGIDDGLRTERYHLHRTLRAVDLARLLTAAIQRAAREDVDVDPAALAARVAELRSLIEEEVRDRVAAIEFDEARHATSGRTADPFDIEMARATSAELDHIREAIRPLARRLASQLRRRRRSTRGGRIDVRRTIHRSRRTGGVPMDVVTRRPSPRRPELFVLCDVSGSVADFSSFTLSLISGLADELSSTRTFAFVDAIDEITALLEAAPDVIEPWQLLQSGRVIGRDGHSDYGTVLASFWERYGSSALGDRSTVIVIGDARGNRRPPRADVLAAIAARARDVYWLNPEPRHDWDTHDSTQSTYAEHCTAVYEVRTLGQLSSAVLQML